MSGYWNMEEEALDRT